MDTALQKNQPILTIFLGDNVVQASLWQVEHDQLIVSSRSRAHNFAGIKNCLIKTDEALQNLGKKSEGVEQTIFGFDPAWIKSGELIDEKKPLLKKITTELSLKPVGFVSSSEAIIQKFSKMETLYSGIFFHVSEQKIAVDLISRGEIKGTEVVGRSDNIAADVAEALARFKKQLGKDHLPTKFLLESIYLPNERLVELQQQLIKSNWPSSLNLLHEPIIEVLPANFLIDTITQEGSRALFGKDMIISQGLKSDFTPIKPEIGFSTQRHLTKSSIKPSDSVSEINKVSNEPPLMNLPSEKKQPHQFKKISHLPFIIAGILGGTIVLTLIFFLFGLSKLSVQVDLELNTKTITKEAKISLDSQASSPDAEKLILPAKTEAKEISGTKTIDTVGLKMIGEKATGQIEIVNKTDSEKILESGTLFSTGDLEFTLDEEVKIASSSTESNSDGETKKYGKEQARVTAVEIGADGNISKETSLQVADFADSSFSAQALEDFSGGSSREVRVVSDQDLENLRSQLADELMEIAANELKDESTQGIYFVPTPSYKIESEEFSDQEGDEVDRLSLDLTIVADALSYQVNDLKPLAKELLSSNVPEGYELSESEPQILSDLVSGSDEIVEIDAQVSSKVIPVVSRQDLVNKILGQNLKDALSQLKSMEQIKAVKIFINPSWMSPFWKKIPKNSDKVIIDFSNYD